MANVLSVDVSKRTLVLAKVMVVVMEILGNWKKIQKTFFQISIQSNSDVTHGTLLRERFEQRHAVKITHMLNKTISLA